MTAVYRGIACGLVLIWASRLEGAEPPVTALAFAPGGQSLVVGSSKGIEVRSWPDLAPQRRLPTQLRQVHDLAFSPDGKVLAAVGGKPAESGEIERFSWPEGQLVAHDAPHDDLIHAVAWRDDGLAFATASADGLVLIHASAGGDPTPLEGHSRGVLAVAFVEKAVVTAGLDQSVRVWEPDTGGLIRALNNHTGPVVGLAVRPGQAKGAPPMVASIGLDRTARLWQPTIGRLVRLARLESPPLAVAWGARGDMLAVSCADGKVRLIDPETVKTTRVLPAMTGWAHSLAIAPGENGNALAVGGEDGRVVRINNQQSRIKEFRED